ncbi:DUF1772 domain-containing protein [Phytoactinopolyspora alkaliphila]|uniref:DUF1772 domain-containing protein n=1 Tax=Phytoactinopolyspora alkaliphila TaxID=1783498 RepID=A0A6N9YS03_9ACTN|nr:anthrone oxygenase family protein [Phytoactinopolyspora alkaliphila]NED97762.1 DUF1772 domain-containing protein [Phytoactinopolyspora alkaliphila]
MMDGFVYALTLVTAVLSGLMAGSYFVFSVMVMPALARLPSASAVAAMQAINAAAVRPWFMTAFFLPTVLSLVLIVVSVANWGEDAAALVLAGSVVFLAGNFALTAGFHVPRNNALADVDPKAPEAQERWAGYLSSWTTGNHLRAAACLAAAALLTVALAT